ncbi:MAG: rhomboid family intramembrane serine protease [Bacteriovoracaceae bacterium]|nr:rhomboid family intramembrane serine protease [Bacteriovoracaceae bacterium]
MFIPLGLGFRTKNFPLATWLIILACSFVFYFGHQKKNYEAEYMSLPAHHELMKAHDNLFYEYCQKELGNALCERFAFERGIDSQRQESYPLLGLDFHLSREALKEFSDLYRDFVSKLDDRKGQIKALPSFSNYNNALESLKSQTQSIRKNYHLLHHDNLNIQALIIAVFSHESFAHLAGNMLFLFIFGRYVEQRVGITTFLGSYLVLGSTALAIYAWSNSAPFLHVLGASANVSVVMGAFYALFFHNKLKIFFFYLAFKIAQFPVKTYMFFFFMLQEFIYSFTAQENVAYSAHALGLVFGMAFGYGYRRIRPVPKYFLYEQETKDWSRIQKEPDKAKFIDEALDIVKFNPNNKVVIREIVKRLAPNNDDIAGLDLDEEILLRELMPSYLKDLYNYKKFPEIYQALERVPHTWSMSMCLRRFGQKDLLVLIDQAIDDEKLLVSVLAIQAFVERYKRSRKVYNLLKTLRSVLDHIQIDTYWKRHLVQIKSLTTSEGLKRMIDQKLTEQL